MEALEELKLTGRLPSPPGVGMTILKLTRGDNFCMEDVARAIQSDPALTGRVLKLTNSARNAAVRPITTVEEAVKRLGVSTLRSVALGFSLISAYREGECASFDFVAFWSRSLARALAAQFVARELERGSPPEAYITGLLSGIGKLALACVHPVQYGKILESNKEEDLLAAERDAFNLDHAQLGCAMLRDWGLPDSIAQVLLHLENKGGNIVGTQSTLDLVEVLSIADPIAAACCAGDVLTSAHRRALENALAQSGLEKDRFQELCDEVAASWQDWGRILRIETRKVPRFVIAGDGAGNPDGSSMQLVRTLPAEDGEDGSEAVPSESLIVLIVDEDELSVRILSKSLSGPQLKILTCTRGEEALAVIMDSLPDIILCNHQLRGTSGEELVATLRACAEVEQVYFVLMSASTDDKAELKAYRSGVDDFMTKPADPELVRAHIEAGARQVATKRKLEAARREREAQMADLAVLNRKLKKASLTDPLTELPNRRAAMDALKSTWSRARRTPSSQVSLIMMDIDHFKSVNDQYGHDVGDEVLRQTAAVFEEQCRGGERVARIGGEEFLLICGPDLNDNLEVLAERLRQAVESRHITFGDFDGHVTISVGLASGDAKTEDYEVVLRRADEALYKAKESGRNQVCVLPSEAML